MSRQDEVACSSALTLFWALGQIQLKLHTNIAYFFRIVRAQADSLTPVIFFRDSQFFVAIEVSGWKGRVKHLTRTFGDSTQSYACRCYFPVSIHTNTSYGNCDLTHLKGELVRWLNNHSFRSQKNSISRDSPQTLNVRLQLLIDGSTDNSKSCRHVSTENDLQYIHLPLPN